MRDCAINCAYSWFACISEKYFHPGINCAKLVILAVGGWGKPDSWLCYIHFLFALSVYTSQHLVLSFFARLFGSRQFIRGIRAWRCDIGKLLLQKTDLKQIGRFVMYQILTSDPNTDSSSYPRTQQTSSSPYLRQFKPEWVQSFPWLHYSRHTDGAFCRACALFAPSDVKGQKLSYFVTKPFMKWIKMTSKHSKQEYHQLAVVKMDELIQRYKNPP